MCFSFLKDLVKICRVFTNNKKLDFVEIIHICISIDISSCIIFALFLHT